MNNAEYWKLVESSHSFNGRELEENLKRHLGELSKVDLEEFIRLHNSFRSKCYTGKVAGFANLVFGGCAETLFANFSAWASLQKQAFFDQLISNDPDKTVDYLKQCSLVARETTGMALFEVARERFGDDCDFGPTSSMSVQDDEIEEDLFAQEFPAAFDAFSNVWLRDGSSSKWPYGSK